jgi:biopolymer transport protein ExbD
MNLRRTATLVSDRVDIQMTPMIDIVFLLLIFFLFSFKIVAQEGDFNIRMPVAGPVSTTIDTQLPLKVRLLSDAEGNLTGIQLADRRVANFAALREEVISIVGSDAGPGAAESTEAEINFDFDLKYRYVIAAVTAISGYVSPDGHIVKLIQKIKFSPLKKPE